MKHLTIILTTLILWGIQSCNKPGDNESNLPPPQDSTVTNPPTSKPDSVLVKPDSVLLLTKVQSTGNPGTLLFEYDNLNRLVKVSKPFNQSDPIISLLFYKDGRISTIISQSTTYSINDKASAIFYYNASGKCSKVVYKRRKCCLQNDNPYYHTVTDSNDVHSYDTLIYNSYGQLSQMNKYWTGGRIAEAVRYFYNSSNDTIPLRLEKTNSYNGNKYELSIITSNMENPGLRGMWFFPFLAHTTFEAGTGWKVSLPLLFDTPVGEDLDEYLSFFPKCVTSYTYGENGQWSRGLGTFVYGYSKDSLTFQGVIPNAWPDEKVIYTFTKVKK